MNVDPAALGLPIAAFVRVRPTPGQLSRVSELAARIPQVSECHRITGEDCLLLKVHAPDVEQLEAILDQFLVHGQTTTSVVVSIHAATSIAACPASEGCSRDGC